MMDVRVPEVGTVIRSVSGLFPMNSLDRFASCRLYGDEGVDELTVNFQPHALLMEWGT